MTRLALLLATLTIGGPSLAQTAPTPAPTATPQAGAPSSGGQMMPPPEFMAAAQAYGGCIERGAAATPAATPEAVAHQTVLGCATERRALDANFESWIANPIFPADRRATAHEQYTARMANVETQIADRIREMRGAATPAPAPTPGAMPTPAPTPTR